MLGSQVSQLSGEKFYRRWNSGYGNLDLFQRHIENSCAYTVVAGLPYRRQGSDVRLHRFVAVVSLRSVWFRLMPRAVNRFAGLFSFGYGQAIL